MAKVKSSESSKRRRPAITPEARDNQLISLAVDLAEKQLLDGSASPSVITHYLKLGTMQEKLKLEQMKKENELLEAKTESLRSQKRMDELYMEAIAAMKNYSGHGDSDDY